jgi:hypothetical protein
MQLNTGAGNGGLRCAFLWTAAKSEGNVPVSRKFVKVQNRPQPAQFFFMLLLNNARFRR